MLSIEDVQLVKDYVYSGFPELEGRVAIRSFDPPAIPERPPTIFAFSKKPKSHKKWLDEQEDQILEDILDQTPPKNRPGIERSFKIAACQRFWERSKEIRYSFLESCLGPDPIMLPMIPVLRAPRRFGIYPDHFYITQSSLDDDVEFLEWFFGKEHDQPVTQEMRRVSEIFALIHEFGHVIKANYFSNADEQECISDVFAGGGTVTIMGEEALPIIEMIADMREASPRYFKAGVVLRKALKDKERLTDALKAKDSFAFAKSTFEDCKPVFNLFGC